MSTGQEETMSSPHVRAYQQVADQQKRIAEQKARDELIVSHLPLVRHVIGRLVGTLPPGVDVDNLESAGVLGLVEAAGKFDPTRNAQFKSFAYLRVRGAVMDELRRNSPIPQHMMERMSLIKKAYRKLPAPVTVEALATETGLSIEDVTDSLAAERFGRMISWEQTAQPNGLGLAEYSPPPDEEAQKDEELKQLTEAIELLESKERAVVTMYYREDLRLREIAEVLKLSVSRISRILTKALFELGEILRSKKGNSHLTLPSVETEKQFE